jgi:branched-chain amino acid transport system ATP-binding protein
MAVLEVAGVTKMFGGLVANEDISLEVHEGEIVSLIGPNGAGKTTLFNCITGYYRVDDGTVRFQNCRIDHLSPNEICHRGLVRTFQVTRPFSTMTVLENVVAGALARDKNMRTAREEAMKILELGKLYEKRDVLGSDLTTADRKRLEVCRALATKPVLLMLDEAMAGLTPSEQTEAIKLIRDIQGQGITVFMVEHVMEVVMPISDRVIVLCQGQRIAEGTPEEISTDERVIEAYLGERHRA